MNQDHSELIEYLDGKFGEVNTRIDKLENKFDKKFDQLVTAIDKLTKSVENLKEEYIAISAKIDIHEKWIQQIANKLNIKLES